jgi:hypothetical protein
MNPAPSKNSMFQKRRLAGNNEDMNKKEGAG